MAERAVRDTASAGRTIKVHQAMPVVAVGKGIRAAMICQNREGRVPMGG